MINKHKAECVVTIITKASHQVYSHTFSGITEKFDPDKEITKFQFTTYQGELKLEHSKFKTEDLWLEDGENDLYYRTSQ